MTDVGWRVFSQGKGTGCQTGKMTVKFRSDGENLENGPEQWTAGKQLHLLQPARFLSAI